MKLTCAIIDDEPLAVELLESYVRKTPFLELKGAYNGGITALEALKTEPVDLLFCDIQMPELNGMELSRMLPARTRVVFTTAFDRYAVEGFRVGAVDYLLKPISAERLQQAVERAQRAIAGDASIVPMAPIPRRLALPIGRRMQMVELDELDCALAQANYVELKVGSRSFVLRDTISGFHARLDPQRFLRIHRSAIVRLDAIREVEPLASGRYRVSLHSGQRLVSGRSYRDALRVALGLSGEQSTMRVSA